MSWGTAARLGLARSPRSPQQQNIQFFIYFFGTNAGDTNRSRSTIAAAAQQRVTAAATAALAAAAGVRRGWRWQWRLRRRRCGIPTVVDKISTGYDTTQQPRTRPYRRERGSTGLLAPTPEVACTRHASPATLCASASRLSCVYRCQAQRTASSVYCVLPCGLCPPSCLESNGGVKLGICRPIV